MVLYILADWISFLEIQRLQLAGSSSTVFAFNIITTATYSQPFTAFNFAIDNDQKALFPTAKGRFRLYISATYHPDVFVSVCYWHLSACYLYVVVYYPYVSVCCPYVVLVCTRMYLCVTRILPRVIPLCICVVFLVKILVNGRGKRLRTQ